MMERHARRRQRIARPSFRVVWVVVAVEDVRGALLPVAAKLLLQEDSADAERRSAQFDRVMTWITPLTYKDPNRATASFGE